MMMNGNLLFNEMQETSNSLRCLRPISVISGSRRVSVPCGKCNACLKAKSLSASNKIQQHARNFKYVFFVTLTYSPEYAPYYAFNIDSSEHYLNSSGKPCYLTRFVPRMSDSLYRRSDLPLESYVNPAELRSFSSQQLYNQDDTVMLCNIDDLQLFLKRIRKFYSYENKRSIVGTSRSFTSPQSLRNYKSTFVDCFSLESRFTGKPFGEALKECAPATFLSGKPDFSYFACSEYGDTTKRPHYHLLFFTNSDIVACTLGDVISQCWQYGRIDFQLSQGYCAQYVAGYLNSYGLLPDFISQGIGRPFSVHSLYSRIPDKYRPLNSATYEAICSEAFDGTVVATSGRFVTRRLAPDLLHSLFFSPRDDVRRDPTSFARLYQCVFSFFRYYSDRANTDGEGDEGCNGKRISFVNPIFPQSVEPSKDLSAYILFDLFASVHDGSGSFSDLLYDELPSYVRVVVEYLDIKPFFRSYHYFRTSLDVLNSPLVGIAVGRVCRLLRAVRTVCRIRRCTTHADFGELLRQSVEFYQLYYSRKLHDFYAKLENHSESYVEMLYRLSDMAYYTEIADDGDNPESFCYDTDTFISICFDKQQKNFKPRSKHNPNV